MMEAVLTFCAMRKQWVRLIQKVYHIDPLMCQKCQGNMEIISFISESGIVIRKILVQLDFRDFRNDNPPIKKPVQILELTYSNACSQLPFTDAWVQY